MSSAERANRRNGYRERSWETRLGTLELVVPKLRQGGATYRACSSPARVAVVQEAYVQGMSTRKVDDLVQALGLASKRQVFRLL